MGEVEKRRSWKTDESCYLQNDREKYPIRPKLMLLEFDERFAVFKDDFAFYDYKQPIKLDRKDNAACKR